MMGMSTFVSGIVMGHQALTSQLTSAYLRARLAGQQVTPRAALDMQIEAHKQVANFVRIADALTTRYMNETTGGALTDTSATAKGALLVGTLRAMAFDHVSELTRRVRGTDLKTLFTDEASGPIKQLLRISQANVTFTSRDSAGRTWPADRLVEFIARDFAYQLAIDAQARRLAEEGDLAQVSYPDAGHENNGLVVSLSGADARFPSLADIRATVFHPNASASLIHVLANV
jgi:hypothetical protein